MGTPTRQFFSIDAVSRDLGIGKDTLRVWERRYGFPRPRRGAQGERAYSLEQLSRLRAIRRLMDLGYRPGKIVGLSESALELMSQTAEKEINSAHLLFYAEQLIHSARQRNPAEFRNRLLIALREQGNEAFVLDTVAPLLQQIGEKWADGKLPIYAEHFMSGIIAKVLNRAISACTATEPVRRVLMTTLPGERHGLGLLMVETLLATHGRLTFNLGVETPVDQILEATAYFEPHHVALSFSSIQTRGAVLATLRELVAALPEEVTLVAGGRGVTRLRRIPQRVVLIKDLRNFPRAI